MLSQVDQKIINVENAKNLSILFLDASYDTRSIKNPLAPFLAEQAYDIESTKNSTA